MPCPRHRNLCAYPDWHPDSCEYCHCDWSKITAPATRITLEAGFAPAKRGQSRQAVMVEEVTYLPGYGETPLTHLWNHAEEAIRRMTSNQRRVA